MGINNLKFVYCGQEFCVNAENNSTSQKIVEAFNEQFKLAGLPEMCAVVDSSEAQAKESYNKSIEQSFLSELEALLQKWNATIHISGPNDWSSQPHLYIVIDGIYEEQEVLEDDGNLLYMDYVTIRPEVEFRYVHHQLPKEK